MNKEILWAYLTDQKAYSALHNNYLLTVCGEDSSGNYRWMIDDLKVLTGHKDPIDGVQLFGSSDDLDWSLREAEAAALLGKDYIPAILGLKVKGCPF